ncbi:hypothetical protein [Lacticaseibacillus saniviri]
MTSKEFAIELDVNDMETNIYMRVTRDDLTAISAGIQELLECANDWPTQIGGF